MSAPYLHTEQPSVREKPEGSKLSVRVANLQIWPTRDHTVDRLCYGAQHVLLRLNLQTFGFCGRDAHHTRMGGSVAVKHVSTSAL